MKTLLIDTCTSNLKIAISENNNLLTSFNQKLDTELSVKTLAIIKEQLEKVNINPNEIENIIVANGPGSFTGIRIGVTIAKTYAWSLNKKIIPVSSLEIMASTSSSSKYIVSLIDARRDAVYAGIYDQNLNNIVQDTYITIEELKKILQNYPDYILISNDKINNLDNIIKPNIDFMKIINKHINEESINPHNVNPNYLKLTEAEVNSNKSA